MPVVKGDLRLQTGGEATPHSNPVGTVHNGQRRPLDLQQTPKSIFPLDYQWHYYGGWLWERSVRQEDNGSL